MSNSDVTCRPGRSANISTTARCFGAESPTGPFSDRISSGPRSATCTGANIRRLALLRASAGPAKRPSPGLRARIPRLYRAPPGRNQGATVAAEGEQRRVPE